MKSMMGLRECAAVPVRQVARSAAPCSVSVPAHEKRMGSASRVVLRRALDEKDSMSWGRKQQEAEELDLNPGDSTTDTLVNGMSRKEDQQPEEDALEAMERGMEMAGAGQWRAALAAFDFALNHHMKQTVATSRAPASDGRVTRENGARVQPPPVPHMFGERAPSKGLLSVDSNGGLSKVEKISVLYNMACCHSGLGNTRAGISALKDAVDIGFDDFDTARSDPDLAALRAKPEFEGMLMRSSQNTELQKKKKGFGGFLAGKLW